MLPATLGWDRSDRSLENLEQGLLNAFPGDIPGDRWVLGLAGDLVDLVDVDDPLLGPLDVEVGRLDQLEEDVLDVLADVAGFGQSGGIGDGKGNVELAGQGLGEEGLAAPGGTDQEDVRLLQLDVVAAMLAASGSACSGCRRPPPASSWRDPARRRSRRGRSRSRPAWAVR